MTIIVHTIESKISTIESKMSATANVARENEEIIKLKEDLLNEGERYRQLEHKARRTRAHLSRVLVIRDKLDRQNFLVCGQHLRNFRH